MAQPLSTFRGRLQIVAGNVSDAFTNFQNTSTPAIDIAKIRSFVPGQGTRSQVDVTGWEDESRKFLSSITEPGEGTLTTIQSRDDYGQRLLYEKHKSGAPTGFRLLIPKEPGAPLSGTMDDDYYVDTFIANVSGWSPNYPPDGGAIEDTWTLQFTGSAFIDYSEATAPV